MPELIWEFFPKVDIKLYPSGPLWGATVVILTKEVKKYIQQVIGTFLYYSRAVDSTMLTTLSSIASTQAEPTEETMSNIHFS